jgi:hypothetical protein
VTPIFIKVLSSASVSIPLAITLIPACLQKSTVAITADFLTESVSIPLTSAYQFSEIREKWRHPVETRVFRAEIVDRNFKVLILVMIHG